MLIRANIMLYYVVTILIVNSGLGAMGCLNSGRKTVDYNYECELRRKPMTGRV